MNKITKKTSAKKLKYFKQRHDKDCEIGRMTKYIKKNDFKFSSYKVVLKSGAVLARNSLFHLMCTRRLYLQFLLSFLNFEKKNEKHTQSVLHSLLST